MQQSTPEINIKTDFNLRNQCPSAVANYPCASDDAGKEWNFDNNSSCNNSDQNSDDSWCPKGWPTNNSVSQQNKSNARKTEHNRRK